MFALPFLDQPLDTVGYLIAGYIFLIGLPLLYVISWWVRQRSLERDLETIETLAADEQKRGAKPAAASGAADLSAKVDKSSSP